MKLTFTVRLFLVLVLFSTAVFSASAFPLTYETILEYTLDSNRPVMNPRVNANCETTDGDFYYIVIPFEVTASGEYIPEDQSNNVTYMDGVIGIYDGPFNPADVTINCVDAVDISRLVELEAGIMYYLVATSYRDINNREGTGSYKYIFSGPGMVLFYMPPEVDPVDPADPVNKDPVEPPFGTDGRINRDLAAPFVAYAAAGRLHIYSPQGEILLVVTADEIAEVGCPDVNTLIAEANGVQVYRLSTCEFQMVGPTLDGSKSYNVITTSLVGGVVTTFEE